MVTSEISIGKVVLMAYKYEPIISLWILVSFQGLVFDEL
jgi:hypothetical protein